MAASSGAKNLSDDKTNEAVAAQVATSAAEAVKRLQKAAETVAADAEKRQTSTAEPQAGTIVDRLRGWIAPHWPREHGGMDATIRQRLILLEEAARAGAPELSNQAIYHIGPIIIRFGTAEQKARHLPSMLDGSVTWCQGYGKSQGWRALALPEERKRSPTVSMSLTPEHHPNPP